MAEANSIVIPPRVKDLTGKVFGRLTVVEYAGTSKHGDAQWTCRCECGATCVVLRTNLIGRQTTSCGCFQREHAAKARTTHGRRYTPEYKVWGALIRRCHVPTANRYHAYGGRGITVCDSWRESFEAFYEDMGPRPSDKHSIERKDNDKGYCKENCCWATSKEQTRNRRSNVTITFQGRTMCLADWAANRELRIDTLWNRLNRLGWSIERALTTPVHHKSDPSNESPPIRDDLSQYSS